MNHSKSLSNKDLNLLIDNSWSKIAPFWPLKSLVAVNPISGLEDLPFKEALKQANVYFQKKIPHEMGTVNRHSIKWLQAFFDEGQATVRMPMRSSGFLKSAISLIGFDKKIIGGNKEKRQWLDSLPESPEDIITSCFSYLSLSSSEQALFLTLMLTTLPGWASYILYRTKWADDISDQYADFPISQPEYLAFRLVLTCLIWPEAKQLLDWYAQAFKEADASDSYSAIMNDEAKYQAELFSIVKNGTPSDLPSNADAKLVFCIDVRSEPFRRAIEAQGNYETLGFAGFFGVPVSVENTITKKPHASCPVLLKPHHHVVEHPCSNAEACRRSYKRLQNFKRLYQSLKYNFLTSFGLVETIGFFTGIWMAIKNFFPVLSGGISAGLKKVTYPAYSLIPDLAHIPLDEQVSYGANALKMMGLTDAFSPLIVLCGHGSTTQNNPYAASLDCGACGGHHGAPNARILASILNNPNIRDALLSYDIHIPPQTVFLAAEHNTTTDAVELFDEGVSDAFKEKIAKLKYDLSIARQENNAWRAKRMHLSPSNQAKARSALYKRSQDWAEVRPEWGLAQNAAFIVGPRWLTKNIDLNGRAFLHSYEWKKDSDCASLTTILTAPMIVAQWINAQYLFSTLDNIAFGAGSKVTTNITGKIGLMQGNASDLMSGLPLQSVFETDKKRYHQAVRLTVIVYAPQAYIDSIIQENEQLQTLFKNEWLSLVCYAPDSDNRFMLKRDLTWTNLSATS